MASAFDFDELESQFQAQDAPASPDGKAPEDAATQPQPLPRHLARLFGLDLEQDIDVISVPSNAAVRVAVASDIHVDSADNVKWLSEHLPKTRGGYFDVLVLPGDVAEGEAAFEGALRMFLRSFDLVCFTPGNHELWLTGERQHADSLQKLRSLFRMCRRLGVRTRPVCLKADPDVLLVPLLSWYSSAWDREPDLPYRPAGEPAFSDFDLIRWPSEVQSLPGFSFGSGGTSPTLSELFAHANAAWLAAAEQLRAGIVISFSHFLPRQELLPEKRFVIDGDLHRVSGSDALERQVRQLRPHVHLCGHSHMPFDLKLQGQRYVQWALGVPAEWQRLNTRIVGYTGLLVLYNAREPEGLAPQQYTFWGAHYQKHERDVSEVCPAPWLRAQLVRPCKKQGIVIPFDNDHFWEKTPNPGKPPARYDEPGICDKRWRL